MSGFDGGVAFWMDSCCVEQGNPTDAELAVMALLAYIAACMNLVTWQTPDCDSRCWLMVQAARTTALAGLDMAGYARLVWISAIFVHFCGDGVAARA